jgi:hypothetical protein
VREVQLIALTKDEVLHAAWDYGRHPLDFLSKKSFESGTRVFLLRRRVLFVRKRVLQKKRKFCEKGSTNLAAALQAEKIQFTIRSADRENSA